MQTKNDSATNTGSAETTPPKTRMRPNTYAQTIKAVIPQKRWVAFRISATK